MLSRKFAMCSPDVKCTLFKSFCSNMYCSTMWYNGAVTAMRKLKIAYRCCGVSIWMLSVSVPYSFSYHCSIVKFYIVDPVLFLIWYAMPCHAVPCRAVPCHAMPCHAMPCHAMPCHAMPCHAIPYHTIPYHTIPYHTIPYHTIPYHTIPYHTIPYHTIPYHTIPYHTIPYNLEN